MRLVPVLFAAGGLALAGSSGFLASQALSASNQQAPTRTITVNVGGTGEQGPQGPAGPPGPKGEKGDPGPPGETSCPDGFTLGVLVINHPGGHVTIATCLEG